MDGLEGRATGRNSQPVCGARNGPLAAVEEALDHGTMPRVDDYPDHLFVVLASVRTGTGERMGVVELDMFITDSVLVTIHEQCHRAINRLSPRQPRANSRHLQPGTTRRPDCPARWTKVLSTLRSPRNRNRRSRGGGAESRPPHPARSARLAS